MPNLNVGLGLAFCAIGAAVAETVVIQTSTQKIVAGTNIGYTYSCTSGSLKTCKSGYLKLTYTLSCTSSNTTCKAASCSTSGGTCVCPYNAYNSSTSGCVTCYGGMRAVSPGATGVNTYHSSTSCNYCDYGQYPFLPTGQTQKVCTSCPASTPYSDGQTCNSGTSCSAGYYNDSSATCKQCPSPGTSAGGKIDITKCYVPKSYTWGSSDAAGSFKLNYTADCYYTK